MAKSIKFSREKSELAIRRYRSGFFLSSFQKWLEEVPLKEAQPMVFADLGYGVLDDAMVEVAAYCLEAA